MFRTIATTILLGVSAAVCGQATMPTKATMTLNAPGTTSPIISRYIYGHFAEDLGRCIYDGFWTGDSIRMDVVTALKRIRVPDLRWPGGCFADQYHWTDGVGPRDKRPTRVNTTWGMIPDDNSFGSQEFLQLCRLIGCDPYIAGNVGTGTPQEMENWLEYLNYNGKSTLAQQRASDGHPDPYKVSLWGVGNESWGCGGSMTPEFYSDQFRRYAEFCKNYPGTPLKKIASGPNSDDYNWTEVCMKNIPHWMMYALSLHYYTVVGNWSHKGSATAFGEEEYYTGLRKCLFMDTLVQKHSAIMDKYDPEKHVALAVDEWGIWTDAEPGTNPSFLYQQNSLRDALIAATTLNIFNTHADRVRMANLAQAVNVLQSLVLTRGAQMVLTPTYWVFDLYKVHQDARAVPFTLNVPSYRGIPAVNASASQGKDGVVHISLVNIDPSSSVSLSADVAALRASSVSGVALTSGHFTDINTFESPDKVKPSAFNGAHLNGGTLTATLPPMSVVVLELR